MVGKNFKRKNLSIKIRKEMNHIDVELDELFIYRSNIEHCGNELKQKKVVTLLL